MQKLSKKENVLQAVKFTLFSASAGIIQVVFFTVLLELVKFSYWPSYLISLLLSILWNFTLNRNYTFKSAANVPVAMLKILAFYAVFTPVTTILGDYLTEELGCLEYLVLAGTMLLNFVLEFLYCRFFVYRNSINTKKK